MKNNLLRSAPLFPCPPQEMPLPQVPVAVGRTQAASCSLPRAKLTSQGGMSQGGMCVLGSQRPEGTVLAFHILRG